MTWSWIKLIIYEVYSEATNDVFYSNMSYVSEFSQINFRVWLSYFTIFLVEFNMRQPNEVAHGLTREVLLWASSTIYFKK